ncbi:MAG: hypothetical protein JSR27_06895 [Proteobacteria bacterium]|nr:hypothetical protein [Pseudomonadota bacterium]
MLRHILLSLVLLSTAAQAQYVSTRLGTIEPYRGMYYDRNQSGSGLSVDVGPSGLMFLQFATYDAAGNQVNYITQPNFTPSDEATRAATGVIGTATAQAYYVTNGQCAGCSYKQPTINPLNLYPTFTWTRPRHVDMTFTQNGQTFTYHFDAGNYEGKNDAEFLPGTFAISILTDTSAFPNGGSSYGNLVANLDIVRVVPAPFAKVTLAPGTDPSVPLPPAGASLYVIQCGQVSPAPTSAGLKPCLVLPDFFAQYAINAANPPSEQTLLWFDPATSAAGMQTVNTDGTVGPVTIAGALYVSPASLTAHLGTYGNSASGSNWYQAGQIFMGVTLTRVPDPTQRYCYGMNPAISASNNYTIYCSK